MDKLHEGIDFYLAGDLSRALRLFQEYINDDGWDKASAYYHSGLCYSDMNR